MRIELSWESLQVLVAFGCYLVGVVAMGVFAHRYLTRGSFVKEYFLGNRGLGPWVLAMTVAEKSRDIAVLMSLGARARQIRNIFIWQGLVVGGLGTTAGLALGYSIAWVADTYRLIQLDPEVYAIPYVPFHASWFDALWIVGATLAVSAAATLFPARAAACILPVEILRYE